MLHSNQISGIRTESNDLGAFNPPVTTSTKKPRKGTFLIVIAIIIAAVLIIVAVELPTLSSQKHQILKSSNVLEYRVTGYANNTTFTTSTNITISGADETGIGYQSSGFQWFNINVPYIGHDFTVYLSDPSYYGQLVCNQQINTSLGLKSVKLLTTIDDHHSEVRMIDAGLDSHIVYRWTVASLNGTYHYQYELVNTNSTAIGNADTIMRSSSVKGFNKPLDTIGQPGTFGPMPPVNFGLMGCSGTVEVGKGQQFHYVVAGTATGGYILNVGDFKRSDQAGQFLYNSTLSRLPGNPGEVNETVTPGTYWFYIIYRGSTTNVTFDGQEVGGYIIPYWG